MSTITASKKETLYFNTHQKSAFYDFIKSFRYIYNKKCRKDGRTLVLLCIGSDRATGDCLGPIVGHILHQYQKNFVVYGSLSNPVHAQNLNDTINSIYDTFDSPYIIALDASLGIRQHIGYVTLGEGNLFPGIGVNKALPKVGDAYITGIVNVLGGNSHITLQTTHLFHVMSLAEFIAKGILEAINDND